MADNNNNQIKTLQSQLKETTKDLNNWTSQILSFFNIGVTDAIKESISTVKEFDTALAEMKKISDESVKSLKNFQKESFSIANSIGATSLALQSATADWMRLGESLEEAKKSAKTSTILLNISDFNNIDEATQALSALSQAYQELDKMDIVDVLNNIGRKYNIATDELAQALQASADILKNHGNDLNQAVALITAGNAITRDISTTAGGIRNISLRIEGTNEAKEELASLGEDVNDFIVQTKSKTRQLIKNYTAVASNAYQGIDVLDSDGNLKNTYNILLDIAKIYKEIQETDNKTGSNNAQNLIEYLAGKNNSDIASSILQNPNLLENVYESAKNSDGTAIKELDSYMQSLDAKTAQFQNRLQELSTTLIDSDILKGAIDFGTTFINLLDGIINKFDILVPLATAFYTTFALKNGGGLIRLINLINKSPFLATVEFNSDVYDSYVNS